MPGAKREGEPKWFSFPVGQQLSTSLENFPLLQKFCSSDKEKQNVPEFFESRFVWWINNFISKVSAYEHFMDPIEWFMVLASTSPPIPPPNTISSAWCLVITVNWITFYCTIFLSEMTVFLIATSLVHILRPLIITIVFWLVFLILGLHVVLKMLSFPQSVFSWSSSSSTVWHQPSIWTVFLTTGWFVPLLSANWLS